MNASSTQIVAHRVGEVVSRVQLPLENLQYALDTYLHENANWLDPRTRDLLVSVREGVGQVAHSTRTLNGIPISGACAAPPAGVGAD